MAIQATRGCPYKCFYCDIYKTTVVHYRRSVEDIMDEVRMIADLGVKRIEFIDDIFNVNLKHCASFFETVIKEGLDLEFMFPTGLKGDLLTKELIGKNKKDLITVKTPSGEKNFEIIEVKYI